MHLHTFVFISIHELCACLKYYKSHDLIMLHAFILIIFAIAVEKDVSGISGSSSSNIVDWSRSARSKRMLEVNVLVSLITLMYWMI